VGTSWEAAHRRAAGFAPLAPIRLPIEHAIGLVLAAPVVAASDLPPFATSAMDGWAVGGSDRANWRIVGDIPAGDARRTELVTGEAVQVSTGSRLPAGADAVLRREHAVIDRGVLQRSTGSTGSTGSTQVTRAPEPAGADTGLVSGQDIRAAASECRAGETVVQAGVVVTPAVAGMSAAAGADELTVVRRPVAGLLVVGDELLDGGVPHRATIRDALGPMIHPWLTSLGADVRPVRLVPDDPAVLADAVRSAEVDLLVTTGATAHGPHDYVREVMDSVGARLVIDGVDVRPGHPMLLAELSDGRPWIGLPGNPLAAVSGLVTLAAPALRALRGSTPEQAVTIELAHAVQGHPDLARLLPVAGRSVVHHIGPAMLRGLAQATGLALIPPGGVPAGTAVRVLSIAGRGSPGW
jgi:molybdopterin molybdotransferase